MIDVRRGDITTTRDSCIVNSTNTRMSGLNRIDGSIHRAAGEGLLAECQKYVPIKEGDVIMTDAYNLPCDHVIHTIAPIWRGGYSGEAQKLYDCYKRVIKFAFDNGIRSITMPCLATGEYAYPIEESAYVAIKAAMDADQETWGKMTITFMCYTEQLYSAYFEANARPNNNIMYETKRDKILIDCSNLPEKEQKLIRSPGLFGVKKSDELIEREINRYIQENNAPIRIVPRKVDPDTVDVSDMYTSKKVFFGALLPLDTVQVEFRFLQGNKATYILARPVLPASAK